MASPHNPQQGMVLCWCIAAAAAAVKFPTEPFFPVVYVSRHNSETTHQKMHQGLLICWTLNVLIVNKCWTDPHPLHSDELTSMSCTMCVTFRHTCELGPTIRNTVPDSPVLFACSTASFSPLSPIWQAPHLRVKLPVSVNCRALWAAATCEIQG